MLLEFNQIKRLKSKENNFPRRKVKNQHKRREEKLSTYMILKHAGEG